MSYKSESHQILLGSMNLLPPGDKVPEGDALEATNWRVDQVGMLRSRRGVSLEDAPNPAEPVVHSFGRWGTHMYVGQGVSVLRDGATTITSAGDGNPFFFAAMNSSMWIMNRGVQGRDDGSSLYQWGISAPGTAPLLINAVVAGNLVGQYQWYVTFYNALTGIESNPSPASTDPALFANEEAELIIPVSTDPQVTGRNLYRTGGTLGQAYQVLQIGDNTTTDVIDNLSDADATTLDIPMPLTNDAPPAAAGIAGPYFSRILAWSSQANPNRMWWTKPDQPGYFPGAANPGIGQWVDVGDDQEAILRIVCHTRLAIIYKERSIWRLIGDPDTGTLEQTKATLGILGPMAVVNGGSVDYVGTVDGVQKFDFDNLTKLSQRLQPMFQNVVTQIGGIASPAVAIQPINQAAWSTCAMALVNGTLYFAYPDLGNARPSNTLVYHVESDRWGTAVYGGASGAGGFGFAAFFYPVNTNDFWGGDYGGVGILERGTTDGVGVAIWLAWQSAYYNQGYPDNDKIYTSVVIDFAAVSGDRVEVHLYPNNGRDAAVDLGTLVGDGTGRSTMEFSIGDDDSPGLEAKNISVRLESSALGEVVIYSIILYYYVEAREASLVSTIPLDLGSNKVKQFKELQLDMDASQGACEAVFSTDLPDNVIEVQETLEIPMGAGRRNYQLPFTELPCEGRLLQLSVATTAGPYAKFRLYSARVLMRVMGTYIEGHEGWLGFVWDSQEHDFSSALTHIPRGVLIALHSNPIKRSRELELDIETREGVVDVQLLTDLPGNAMTRRFTSTATAPGRRIVRLPLPQTQPTGPGEIEGRLYQLKLASSSTYVLYGARIEILPVGIYIEAYEDAGGAIYDSREQDFGSQKSKDARELQLDIETDAGGVTVKLYGDNGTLRFSGTVDTTLTTTGRRKVNLAIATTIPGVDYSRLWQLVITGTNAFRLYNAALRLRAVGHYVTTDAATGAALYDSTELSLGTQSVKEFRMLEVEIQTAGPATVDFWTDLPSNLLNTRQSQVLNTGDRRTVQIPLPQGGVPDNYVLGRLMQLLISSTGGAYALYGARVQYRALPNYFEAYEAAGGAVYDSRECDFGSPDMKDARELGLDIQADGPVTVTLYGDVSGTMTSRFTTTVNTSGQARRKLDLALAASIPGELDARLWRLVIGSSSSFRLYGAGLKLRAIGHYVDTDAATGAALYDSTELSLGSQGLGSQHVKEFRLLEVELETFGAVTLAFLSDLPGNALASRRAQTVNTSGVRRTVQVPLPQGAVPDNYTLGRLMQVLISGVSAYKLFGARIQYRALPNFFEAYEAAAGAVYDSRECDFGTEKMKDARELGLDIQADGPVTVTLYGDISGTMTQRFTTSVNTTGQARRVLDLALTTFIPGEMDARLWRLVISGTNSFRLYAATLKLRVIGHYVDVDAATHAALYDSTELNLGSQNVKEFRLLELELETFGAVTAQFVTDLPGNAMGAGLAGNVTRTVNTAAVRRTVQIPLPQGAVPDNYMLGRLLQLFISGTSAYKLFGARIQYRIIGTFVEAYEAAAGAVYDSRECDFGTEKMKDARELGLDIQADGPATITLYGDVSGVMTQRFTTTVDTTGQARRKLDLALTASIPGEMDARLWRLVISGANSFRLYGASLKMRAIGHYVDVDAATGAALYDSTELSLGSQGLGSQHVKEFRLLELELETFGAVTLAFLSDLPGNALTSRQAQTVSTGGVRRTVQVPLPQGAVPDNYLLGRLIQVLISGTSAYKLFGARVQYRAIANFFEAYEAAAGAVYDSRECDFGTEKMKDARELGLDIQADGVTTVTLYGDVSGTMTQRFTTTVNTTGQARRKLDLALTASIPGEMDARLWRLVISGANSFRLYGASLKIRAIGHYVDVDAATGAALYDSTELSLGSQNVKEFRLLELELETFGAVTAAFRCDLPGNAVLTQAGESLNTSGVRRTVQIPLPQGAVPDNYMLGRLMQVLIWGTSAYKLFGARVQYRAIGTFVEAYEAAAGAVYDSRECDFGSPKMKDARLLNLDIQADGAVTVKLYGDVSGTMTQRFTTTVNTMLSPGGGQARRKLDLALTASIPGEMDARLWRLVISGANSFRLYGASLKVRAIGHYIGVDAATGSALYDSTQLQLGAQNVKQFRMLELELHTYGPVTVDFWSDLPGNSLVSRQSQAVDTTGFGRRTVQIPLPQGAEGFPAGAPLSTNYFYGRLMQLLISGTSAYKLFSARVQYRLVGTYVEAYEAAAGAVWDSGPLDMAGDNVFDQLRLEMDSDSACNVTVWTDLPGETLTVRFTLSISTAGFGRRWVTMPLPADTQGRLLKIVVASGGAFRLYQGQISKRSVGRYLAAGVNDTYRSLDQTFGTERVKLFKLLDVDISTDGPLLLTLYTVWTDLPGAQQYQTEINTGGRRTMVRLRLPGNVRGRLARIEIGGASSGRLYGLRGWSKTVGESATSEWAWVKFPVEESASLATWSELPIAPTPTEWTWADLPVEATAAEWTTEEFPVAKTPDEWSWAELPVEKTEPGWKAMPFPVAETPEEWSWADLPVEKTEPGWKAMPFPVAETPEEWSWADLPVEKTEPGWKAMPFPVAETPEEWSWAELPVKATAPEWTWQKFPVAETPNEWTWADLPVDATSPEFQWAKFPVAATPDEWVWAVFPVEETPSEWTWEDVPMGQG